MNETPPAKPSILSIKLKALVSPTSQIKVRMIFAIGTTPDDADKLVERLAAIYPREKIFRSVISPVIGTYSGPNALALTVLEAEKK